MEYRDIYDLVCAVDYCTQLINALADAPDIKDFGIDSDADYNRYYNKLYDLYDIAVKNNVVNEVIQELKSDNIDDRGLFVEIKEEADYLKAQSDREELLDSIEVGDYVLLYNGNRRYVCRRDGRDLWVTDKEEDRLNDYARGWSADLYDVVEILEHYEE